MKIALDTEAKTLTVAEDGSERTFDLYSRAAFEAISRQWVRVGWSLRYYHNFSWLGHAVLQLPEDLLRAQEVIYRLRPDVIVETGVFKGGSLIYYASLCEALGNGRVIGIDCAIEPQVKDAIARHAMGARITLIEGDSVSSAVTNQVAGLIQPTDTVFVMLDSCHTKQHVTQELESYSQLVTPGSYIVATDGVMQDLSDVPGGQSTWTHDNPMAAARDFAERHPEFVPEQPPWLFHDGEITENVTYWPGAWLRRRKP